MGTEDRLTARSRDDGARSRREAAAHRVRGISFIVEPSRRELIDGHNRGKLVLHVGNGSAVSAGGAMIP